MSWIWCLAIAAMVVDQTPSEPRVAAIKVFFNERLGPLEIDRMGLGQGGLSDEPMWDNRVPEIRALHPRLIRLFIQEYFNLFPKRRSEEHTSELQSHLNLVCRLLLEKKKNKNTDRNRGILEIYKSKRAYRVLQ